MSTGREIRLIEDDEGGRSAIDEETGVASQARRGRRHSQTSTRPSS